MNTLIIFTVLSILNVIMSTLKSLITIKGNKFSASLVSAIYYGFYNIVLIYTVADFPMWQKVVVTAGCNLIGVFIVKWGEEKARKDKLWLVKVTVPKAEKYALDKELRVADIPHQFYDITKYFVFDCYCDTQEQTQKVVELCKAHNGKMFATENKLTY